MLKNIRKMAKSSFMVDAAFACGIRQRLRLCAHRAGASGGLRAYAFVTLGRPISPAGLNTGSGSPYFARRAQYGLDLGCVRVWDLAPSQKWDGNSMKCKKVGLNMKKIQNYRAVVWDMDGTLLDTLPDIRDALNETLAAWGLAQVTTEQTLSYIGHGAEYLCRCASRLDGDKLDAFHREYRERSLARPDAKTRTYDGVPDVIRELNARGIPNAIYTNKPQKWCEKLADRFYGGDAFRCIVGSDGRHILKPSPEGLDIIAQTLDVDRRDLVMIGDSDVDYQTAVNAGCHGISVSWGFRTKAFLMENGAQIIVDTPDELRGLLGIESD